jgi:hypothetical protein
VVRPASCPVCTGGSFNGDTDTDHSLPSSAEVKNGGAVPPNPVLLHGMVLNELKA